MLTTVHVYFFFLQKLVCICGDQDSELCGRRWSGDLREAWLPAMFMGHSVRPCCSV